MTTWTIESLLGMSLDDFDKANRSGERIVRRGMLSDNRLHELISLEDLDNIAMSQTLVWPLVRVWNDGTRLPPETYTVPSGAEPEAVRYIDTLKLFRCFRDGGTVVFRDMHRYWEPATRLSWNLSDQLGCAVTVGAFLSPPHTQSLNPHFDYHDLLIIQISGRKTWVSFRSNADLPLDNNNWRTAKDTVDPRIPGTAPETLDSIVLEKGDVLFLPRGFSHAVQSVNEVSFHLTLSLQEWTSFDVATTVLKHVGRDRALRKPLRLGAEKGQTINDQVLADTFADFSQLAGHVGERELEWSLYRNSHTDLFESPIPLTLQYEHHRRFEDTSTFVRRRNLVYAIHENQDSMSLKLRDRTIRFPKESRNVLTLGMSGEPVSVTTCTDASASTEMCRKIFSALLAEGVIVPDAK